MTQLTIQILRYMLSAQCPLHCMWLAYESYLAVIACSTAGGSLVGALLSSAGSSWVIVVLSSPLIILNPLLIGAHFEAQLYKHYWESSRIGKRQSPRTGTRNGWVLGYRQGLAKDAHHLGMTSEIKRNYGWQGFSDGCSSAWHLVGALIMGGMQLNSTWERGQGELSCQWQECF